jgi:flagellar protein FliJ
MKMKRSKRLQPVGQLVDGEERECAARVADLQARLDDAQRRSGELKRYLVEYQSMFQQRAAAGIGVSGLRDYQTFLARLNEAVRQQDNVVSQLESDCARARVEWLEAAARKSAVSKVIENARTEDQKIEERRSQKETDEHAQRRGGAR